MNTQLSIDCTEEMKKRIAGLSKKHGPSISELVRKAIEIGLPKLEEALAASEAVLRRK